MLVLSNIFFNLSIILFMLIFLMFRIIDNITNIRTIIDHVYNNVVNFASSNIIGIASSCKIANSTIYPITYAKNTLFSFMNLVNNKPNISGIINNNNILIITIFTPLLFYKYSKFIFIYFKFLHS